MARIMKIEKKILNYAIPINLYKKVTEKAAEEELDITTTINELIKLALKMTQFEDEGDTIFIKKKDGTEIQLLLAK